MAKLGSSLPPTPPPSSSRFGGRLPGTEGVPPRDAPPVSTYEVGTLPQRLADATRQGALTAVPPAYEEGPDWETVLGDNVFARLYLAAADHASITDAQVQANHTVLADFWQLKLNSLNTGNKDIDERYRPGTVSQAHKRLQAAADALVDKDGRAACFAQLETRRREAAGRQLDEFLRPLLTLPVLNNKAFEQVLAKGVAVGFTLPEAEKHLLTSLENAKYRPVKTVNQSPNLLLAEWTPGGAPLTNRPSTKVMGQDVYTLAEAGQVLYAALTGPVEREKAARNLDSPDYLVKVADALKEPDAAEDLKEINADKKLDQAQRRLKALYLLGPGLPFYLEGQPAFASPADLLARAAISARDFGAAEAAFTAGQLAIWVQAAATAEVKAALPGAGRSKALDFRRFLHQAVPAFPLWIGEEAFTSPVQLAAYLQHNENTWRMVYGSLNAGNLLPWLAALGRLDIMEQQTQVAAALLGPGLEPNSEPGRQLAVQALLQALHPETAMPRLRADRTEVDLTGLSGETHAERIVTLTNETGGAVRVFLEIKPELEGVQLSATELFFDQRAPGQQLTVSVAGNPAQMPRDGQHEAALVVHTVYAVSEVPVRARAVFPLKQFWQFVTGAGTALAVIFGGVRYLLGLTLGEGTYAGMAGRSELLPPNLIWQMRNESGGMLVGLLVLGGLVYVFLRVLVKLAKPHPTA